MGLDPIAVRHAAISRTDVNEAAQPPRQEFGRASLKQVTIYDADAAPVEFDLSDNTNPFGCPPSLKPGLSSGSTSLERYPTTYSAPLREQIAAYVGVNPKEVVLGCGSDELIDCAFRALSEPGARIAYMSPTFVMVRPFALSNALQPVPVPLLEGFRLDVDAILQERPDAVYLCSPNNPTGTMLSDHEIDAVLEHCSCPVILDEAYAEYAGRSRAASAPGSDQLLVVRTLSKAWGMAGLRIGYAVGCRALVSLIERVRGPFKVTALSEQLAEVALRESRPWMEECVRRTTELRERIVAELALMGIHPPESQANFLLIPVRDARAVSHSLLSRGVSVRAFPGVPGVGDAIRVTIGPREAMSRVLDVVRNCQ